MSIRRPVTLLDLAQACQTALNVQDIEGEIERAILNLDHAPSSSEVAARILKEVLKTKRGLLGVLDGQTSSEKFWREEVNRPIENSNLERYFEEVAEEARNRFPEEGEGTLVRKKMQEMLEQIRYLLGQPENERKGRRIAAGMDPVTQLSPETVVRTDIVTQEEKEQQEAQKTSPVPMFGKSQFLEDQKAADILMARLRAAGKIR